jgi:hypothetical protein
MTFAVSGPGSRRGLNRVGRSTGEGVIASLALRRTGNDGARAGALTMEHAPCTLQDFSVALLE